MSARHDRTSRLAARAVLWAAVAAASLAAPQSTGVAHAQDAADPEYERLIASAVHEFDAKHFAEARAAFAQAYARKPNAKARRGMGVAAFENGDYTHALVDLQVALTDTRKPLNESQRNEAIGLVQQATNLVARYSLDKDPQDLQLSVDGVEPTLDANGLLIVGQGAHEISAAAPQRTAVQLHVQVWGGEQTTLALRLAKVEPAPVAAAAVVPVQPSPPPVAAPAPEDKPEDNIDGLEGRHPHSGPPLLTWIAFGAAGASAVGAVVALTKFNHEVGLWNDPACKMGRTREANCGAHREAYESARTWGIVASAATGVFAATGVLAWVLADDERDSSAVLTCEPTGAGVHCSGRF